MRKSQETDKNIGNYRKLLLVPNFSNYRRLGIAMANSSLSSTILRTICTSHSTHSQYIWACCSRDNRYTYYISLDQIRRQQMRQCLSSLDTVHGKENSGTITWTNNLKLTDWREQNESRNKWRDIKKSMFRPPL